MGEAHLELIDRLAAQTVGLLGTEYPNGIRLSMSGPIDEPIRPSAIYPSFFGCYDWHSSVHSHWQLVRALRMHPDGTFAHAAIEFLDQSLTPDNIAVEMQWVDERPNFEMPYGMAWLATLAAELHTWNEPRAAAWSSALEPMEQHAYDRFAHYCDRLALPVRGGMHNQTAFSLGLAHDAAAATGRHELRGLIDQTSRRLYLDDRNINLAFEPSAADFLSPSLAEADLLTRVLTVDEFVDWLPRFVPNGFASLSPVEVVDPSDGQLAHWAGLNLSRAWMLRRIARTLSAGHDAQTNTSNEPLLRSADAHEAVGLPMAAHPEYMVSHWVPTFAVYLITN